MEVSTGEFKTAYISSKIEPSLRERLDLAAEVLGEKPSTLNRIALKQFLDGFSIRQAA